ncbi:hypothetical protein FOA52_005000 [Chlamydomonas sp. UWO 241]|nr:hypothetical protein FOA52_005000 [Chlamydomonas sp. UWO 241]
MLLRRVRSTQPLPYHWILNQGRTELLSTLCGHMDPLDTGSVAAADAESAVAMLNPRLSFPEALAAGTPATASAFAAHQTNQAQLKARDPVAFAKAPRAPLPPMGSGEFAGLAQSATEGLSDEEVAQGVLEVLACRSIGLAGSEPSDLLRALFRHLDASDEGAVPASELQAAALVLAPPACGGSIEQVLAAAAAAAGEGGSSGGDAAAAAAAAGSAGDGGNAAEGVDGDGGALALVRAQLTRLPHEMVTEAQFVSALSHCLSLLGLGASQLETSVFGLMAAGHVRPRHAWDFSRAYIGPSGILPLIHALAADKGFTTLSLRKCGITDSVCAVLCEWLQGHPTITSLDLRDNPIGDAGGVLLTALLVSNPRLVGLDVSGCHLLRSFSRTHHDVLGPSACEGGASIGVALQANRDARAKQPAELVEMFQGSLPELHAMHVAAADPATGRAPLSALHAGASDLAAIWGFAPGMAEGVLVSARLMGAGADSCLDDSADHRVTWGEFALMVDGATPAVRACAAIAHNRAQAKRLFYALAASSAPAPSASDAVAGTCHPGGPGGTLGSGVGTVGAGGAGGAGIADDGEAAAPPDSDVGYDGHVGAGGASNGAADVGGAALAGSTNADSDETNSPADADAEEAPFVPSADGQADPAVAEPASATATAAVAASDWLLAPLVGRPGCASGTAAAAGGASTPVPLSLLCAALVAAAAVPGSGWGVGSAELQDALAPAGGVLGDTGGGDADDAVMVSWPQFYTAVLLALRT